MDFLPREWNDLRWAYFFFLCSYRAFENPSTAVPPPASIVRECVHNFLAAVRRLLRPTSLAIVRRATIPFRRDVFDRLFQFLLARDFWKRGDVIALTPSKTLPLICSLVNGMFVVFRLALPKKFRFLSECLVVSVPPFPIIQVLRLMLAFPLFLTLPTMKKSCLCHSFLSHVRDCSAADLICCIFV